MVVAPLPSGAPPVLEHAKRPLPPHPSFDDESRPAVKARKDPVPYGDPGGAGGRKPCGCKNSKCLKLYCDCFAIGEYCKGCLCVGCHNNVAFEQERQHAMDQIRKKDKTGASSFPSGAMYEKARTGIPGRAAARLRHDVFI